MNILIAIVAFVIVALVGWFIAEAKGKYVTYNNNDQEDAVLQQNRCNLEQNGYTELNHHRLQCCLNITLIIQTNFRKDST